MLSLWGVKHASPRTRIGDFPAKLDHAQRVKYLRCLREIKREDHWNRLREQAWKAGRILLDAGARMAAKTVKRLGNETKEDRSAR